MQKINSLSLKDFVELGYLQEINRLVLHPCGLAMEIVVDDDGKYYFSKIWDYRDDPEGITYGETPKRNKAKSVDAERRKHYPERYKRFGHLDHTADSYSAYVENPAEYGISDKPTILRFCQPPDVQPTGVEQSEQSADVEDQD